MTDQDQLGGAVDVEAIRVRYAAEKAKRMRADGSKQYAEASGDLAHFWHDDPYAEYRIEREPLNDEVDVLIVGAGFAGMMMAARLRDQGVNSVRIVEAGSDFGGTWYWNRYPGAQCDIESYIYLPLLEETGFIPKEKYSYGPEIYEHSQRIAKTYDLEELACFQTRVEEVDWDENLSRWHVHTDRGDDIEARFVVTCLGPAHRPKLPGVPGLKSFEGPMFHTCRWDYDVTGGDTYGNLHRLAGKKVAIIGTGATAIQVVPHVARDAEHLFVFQRTPSSVDVRGNKPTDKAWAASLQPGWQRARQDNFNAITMGLPVEEDLVNDCWTDAQKYGGFMTVADAMTMSMEDIMAQFEVADARKMNEIRQRVDSLVEEETTAEALKPWYRRHCKRPTFNDEYLPTFNRPNVTLVDTSPSQGVEHITRTGVIANGVEHEVDVIIFATGFEISTSMRRRAGLSIKGIGGVNVWDHFEQNGISTFHGHSVNGFPNWFGIGATHNALSANWTSMTDQQTLHVAYIINEVMNRGAATTQPKPEAEKAWVKTCHILAAASNDMFYDCTPGYYTNEGKIDEGDNKFFGELYQPGVAAFNTVLENWRAKGRLDGLELTFPKAEA